METTDRHQFERHANRKGTIEMRKGVTGNWKVPGKHFAEICIKFTCQKVSVQIKKIPIISVLKM